MKRYLVFFGSSNEGHSEIYNYFDDLKECEAFLLNHNWTWVKVFDNMQQKMVLSLSRCH